MDNHSQRTIPHPKKKRSGKKISQKTLLILIAAIVVAAIAIGSIVWSQVRKNNPVSADFIEQTTASEQTDLPQTEATTESTTQGTTAAIQTMDKVMYATASTLNVRKAPSTDSEIIAKYAKGDAVKVTGKHNDDWYIVEINDAQGYCSSKYLAETREAATTTTTQAATQPKETDSQFPYMLTVNRTQNIVIAYAKDASGAYTVPHKAMICSVGLNGATPTGTYKTSNRYTWRLLSGNVYGQYATRITGHILFHSVPYFTKDKSDLEYEEYNKLGQPASLGCVRLTVIDAKWIYDNCPSGTTVKIYDSDEAEPLARPTAPKIDTASPNRGWDPTDPDKKNPWN